MIDAIDQETITKEELIDRIEELEARLQEAEDTLEAIRSGGVDALVVQGDRGEQVFALKSAERPYRVLVESINEGAVIALLDGTITYCNKQFAKMANSSTESIIGSNIAKYASGTNNMIKKIQSASAAKKRFGSFEAKMSRIGSGDITVLVSYIFMDFEGTETIGALITDLTEQKIAQEQIRDREQRLSVMVSQLPAIAWTTDKDLTITSYSGSGLKTLGVTSEEMVGKKFGGAFDLKKEEYRNALSVAQNALKGTAGVYELHVRDHVWESHVNPMHDEEDRIIGLIGISLDVTGEKRKDQMIFESERQLRYLSSQLLVAQEQERKRIAREIHDSIGQSLAGIKMRVQNVLYRIDRGLPRSPETSLENIIPVIQHSIEEVRRIQMDLRPAMLDDLGIIATIDWAVRNFNLTYPAVIIETNIQVSEYEVPDDLKTNIYRILQEPMNNIGKHARADKVTISLVKTKKRLNLTIHDNGQGFDVDKAYTEVSLKGSLGLSSMRERAQLSGADFEIKSAPGKGTTITVSWPVS